jgi:Myb-like DNA-binding domain
MKTKSAYTKEETEQLLDLYKKYGTDHIEEIARALNKPIKSVRSKLVKEKVYVAGDTGYVKKTGKSKKELLRDLEGIIAMDTSGLTGATKESISSLIDFLKRMNLNE